MREPRRAFVTGTFDVANYGDLLFPLVAASRLEPEGIAVTAVSPTDRRPAYADAAAPMAAVAMLDPEGPPADGILIGGGYILIAQAALGMPSYEAAGVTDRAYPSLWIGATLAGALRDIPVLWNAPGAPFPFASGQRDELILPALAAADYRSVRDTASAALFGAGAPAIEVVPDTVLDLPRVWPRERLLADHSALLTRKGFAPATRCLALHVRARALGEDGAVAEAIAALARRTGLVPLLLALGPELGDLPVVRGLSARLTVPHVVLDDAESLREIAAAIAGAALYLGGSLHGYITAAAYGVPGVMLAIPAHGKFSGLLRHLGRESDMTRTWPEAIARAEARLRAGPGALPDAVAHALDRHWAAIVRGLLQPGDGTSRRVAFLRRYLMTGVRRHGPAWLLRPHLPGLR